MMTEAKSRFPDDIDYVVPVDTTLAVTEGMKEIVETLVIAIILVIVVVYIFLQGWRATLIPLLAVPVSLVGTFLVFPLFGFTINTLSLFGLVLAIGLVVDDAIVVVEVGGASHRRWHGSERGGAESHGGDLRTGDRHRAGPLRCFRSDRVHSRDHRQAVSAVRGDHRDLGDSVRVQRAVVQPRAGRAALEAEGGEQGSAGEILRLVQPDVRPRHRGLRPAVRRAHPQERGGRDSAGWLAVWRAISSAANCRPASFPTRTKAIFT